MQLGGVWGSSAALLAAALGRLSGRGVLFVTTSPDAADEVADDIEVFSGRAVQVFPAWETGAAGGHVSDEITGERLRVCDLLSGGASNGGEAGEFVVAPVMALLQPVPTPAALAAGRLELNVGAELDPSELIAWLVDAGFDAVDQVDQQGEFAHRGGIVDVFPPGAGRAVRIEFFGDRIDSIRLFDLDTQRSTERVPSCRVTSPAAGAAVGADACSLLDYLDREHLVCMVDPAEVKCK